MSRHSSHPPPARKPTRFVANKRLESRLRNLDNSRNDLEIATARLKAQNVRLASQVEPEALTDLYEHFRKSR